MANYIDIDDAWDEGTLQDWYINSIDNTISPIWTEEHISELCNDFIIIPKEAPTADVRPEKHGYWIYQEPDDGFSWKPYLCSACGEKGGKNYTEFCPHCGAKMDGEDGNCESNSDNL